MMTNKIRQIIVIALLLTSLVECIAFAESRSLNMAVIAPSVSTSMEARSIMREKGWLETNFRQADGILVVVRSMLFNPLNYSYRSIDDLQKDADMQLNISGEKFHVYIYQINDDLSVTQLKHISYKAD